MENPPFEDVFPIQDGDFPLLCLFTGGYIFFLMQDIAQAENEKYHYHQCCLRWPTMNLCFNAQMLT